MMTPEETGRYDEGELAAIDEIVDRFMQSTGVPSLSVAFGRGGAVAFARAWGLADVDEGVDATPDTVYRIASLSKPITAVGTLWLVEQGHLSLDARVFGPDSILGERFSGPIRDERLFDVTVEQLLSHLGGIWGADGGDPMFDNYDLDQEQLIAHTLERRRLIHAPGSKYEYSNFGYLVLGRVIEEVSGAPYGEWIRDNILGPLGISTMDLAGSSFEDRAEMEATYYDAGTPYDLCVERMDAHGGWLGRAADLVRFAGGVRRVLSARTCRSMWTARDHEGGYGLGWVISGDNAWHAGSLDGVTTIMVRRGSDELCWAGLTNTRDGNPDLDGLLWDIAGAVSEWPDLDLES